MNMHVTYGKMALTSCQCVVQVVCSPLPYLFPSHPASAHHRIVVYLGGLFHSRPNLSDAEVTGKFDISGTALAVSGSSSSNFFARVCPAPHGDPDSLKNVLPFCFCIESDIADDARTSLFCSPPLQASNH